MNEGVINLLTWKI